MACPWQTRRALKKAKVSLDFRAKFRGFFRGAFGGLSALTPAIQAMIAAGIEDDGTAVAVASPGTSFPREWAPLFRGKRTVLCFDTDAPGRLATATVAATLKGHAAEILTRKGAARHV